ncbi:MAG: hypothetical protein OXH70_14025 [Acidobacteria bacterium]|nr:hypothetical protein [Acidobacteriota bacterium]
MADSRSNSRHLAPRTSPLRAAVNARKRIASRVPIHAPDACIVIPWFVDWLERHPGYDWRSLAWFIHDHLPYSEMVFFPVLGPDGKLLPTTGCNLTWRRCLEAPDRPRSCDPRHKIRSFPAGILTAPGMASYAGRHDYRYPDFPDFAAAREPNATVSAAPAASKWPDYLRDARKRKKDEDEWFEELRCQQEAGETNPAFAVWRRHWVREVNKAWKRADKGIGTFSARKRLGMRESLPLRGYQATLRPRAWTSGAGTEGATGIGGGAAGLGGVRPLLCGQRGRHTVGAGRLAEIRPSSDTLEVLADRCVAATG